MPLPLDLLGLSPETEGKEEPINVFEISAEIEKEKERKRIFDPRVDITDVDVYRVFGKLQFAGPHALLMTSFFMQERGEYSDLQEYRQDSRYERHLFNLNGPLDIAIDINNDMEAYLFCEYACAVAQLGRKSDYKHGYDRLLSEYIEPHLASLKQDGTFVTYLGNFAEARIMYPDKFFEKDIPDSMLRKVELHILNMNKDIVVAIKNGERHDLDLSMDALLKALAFYRLAAPERFEELNKFRENEVNIRLKAKMLMEDNFDKYDEARYAIISGYLSILCADDIEYTENGVRLVWRDEVNSNKSEVPKIPAIRRF